MDDAVDHGGGGDLVSEDAAWWRAARRRPTVTSTWSSSQPRTGTADSELEDVVPAGLGNDCDVLVSTPEQVSPLAATEQ